MFFPQEKNVHTPPFSKIIYYLLNDGRLLTLELLYNVKPCVLI